MQPRTRTHRQPWAESKRPPTPPWVGSGETAHITPPYRAQRSMSTGGLSLVWLKKPFPSRRNRCCIHDPKFNVVRRYLYHTSASLAQPRFRLQSGSPWARNQIPRGLTNSCRVACSTRELRSGTTTATTSSPRGSDLAQLCVWLSSNDSFNNRTQLACIQPHCCCISRWWSSKWGCRSWRWWWCNFWLEKPGQPQGRLGSSVTTFVVSYDLQILLPTHYRLCSGTIHLPRLHCHCHPLCCLHAYLFILLVCCCVVLFCRWCFVLPL